LPEKPVIVVLGGGKREEKGFPELLLLSDSASGRLAEGLRLYHLSQDGTLLFSGGTVWGGKPVSEVMAESAVSLGVLRSKVAALTKARATDEEVLEIRDYLQNSASGSAGRIVLVTSASHLPRAMYLFERAGIKPIPAPADFQSLPPGGVSPDRFFPSGQALKTSERAIHEYLGILWILLKK